MDFPNPTTAPAGVVSQLVTDPDSKLALTAYQETDARTAMSRGLREYVEHLQWEGAGGRLTRFRKVYDTWPQAEDEIVFPSALVAAAGPGTYDASRFTPGVKAEPVEGYGIVQVAEMSLDLRVSCWATDNKERMHLVSMLETYLSPAEFMYGLRLELPHYFNNRATYEPLSVDYEDSPESAIRRYRISAIMIRCTMTTLRLVQLPTMTPRFRVVVTTD